MRRNLAITFYKSHRQLSGKQGDTSGVGQEASQSKHQGNEAEEGIRITVPAGDG